jgi:nucleoside-diphosphate-sugar epimerase
MSSSRLRRELGWSPPHPLAEGLDTTARWYREDIGGAAV